MVSGDTGGREPLETAARRTGIEAQGPQQGLQGLGRSRSLVQARAAGAAPVTGTMTETSETGVTLVPLVWQATEPLCGHHTAIVWTASTPPRALFVKESTRKDLGRAQSFAFESRVLTEIGPRIARRNAGAGRPALVATDPVRKVPRELPPPTCSSGRAVTIGRSGFGRQLMGTPAGPATRWTRSK
jgi:hypothetical protein